MLGITPAPLAAGENARPRARAVSGVVQQKTRGAIAKQRGRDEHCRARIIDPQTQAAEFHREEQHKRPVLGVSEARGAGKPRHSSAATEPEHRQSLNRRRQLKTVEKHGVQAWHSEPGRGAGHDHIDRIERDAGRLRSLDGHLFQEIERVPMKRLGAVLPTMWAEIPLYRFTAVPDIDARIVIKPQSFLRCG